MGEGGRLLDRRTAYRGSFLELVAERVELPGGQETELELVRHPGAAAVVPLTDDGDVVLLRQYRHATGGWLLEVPAGKLDAREAPEVCARRELEEETGLAARHLSALGRIWTSPGFTDEVIHLYVARGLEGSRQALQEDEILTVQRVAFPDAVDMAVQGEIEDAKSVCALLRAARHLAAGEQR